MKGGAAWLGQSLEGWMYEVKCIVEGNGAENMYATYYPQRGNGKGGYRKLDLPSRKHMDAL